MSGRGARAGEGSDDRPKALDPTRLFKALEEADIGYIMVGAFAVAAHGAVRATKDLDICPDPDDANLGRLADLLVALDAVNIDEGAFEAEELPPHDLEGLRGGGNFRLMTRLGALDVMQYLKPFEEDTWKTLDKHAEERQAFGHAIRVCAYRDLLDMKEAAGRDQDLIDIKNVKAARREL